MFIEVTGLQNKKCLINVEGIKCVIDVSEDKNEDAKAMVILENDSIYTETEYKKIKSRIGSCARNSHD